MVRKSKIEEKEYRLLPEMTTSPCFLDPTHLELEEEIVLLHDLMQKMQEIHKDLLCGITETGVIFFTNMEYHARFFNGADPVGPHSFFSFVYPEDREDVREFLSGNPQDLVDTEFFCRMISGHNEMITVKWRIWSHETLAAHTPMKYFLIGTTTSTRDKYNILTDFYTLYLQKMEEERQEKIKNIQEKLLHEIAKREAIEKEIETLINGMENEVVKLKEIINYTTQKVLVFDSAGDLQYINTQGADHLGAPMNYLIGKNIADLPFPTNLIRIFTEYSNSNPDPRDPPLYGMMEMDTSSTHVFFYSMMPLYDISGNRESTLVVLSDASDPRESHTPSSFLAEDPKAVIDRTLHTFNNIFTILLGNITLAQCAKNLDTNTCCYLKNIEADIAKAGNLLYRYSLLSSAVKSLDPEFTRIESEYPGQDALPEDGPPESEVKYILFMDDERGIRDIASRVLGSSGYFVVTGHNGEAILKAYVDLKMDKQNVSCAILDLDVPDGMGALETLPHLKFFDPGLPVILTTGHTKHPVVKNFKNYGFSGVITKPFYPRKLKGVVRDVITDQLK